MQKQVWRSLLYMLVVLTAMMMSVVAITVEGIQDESENHPYNETGIFRDDTNVENPDSVLSMVSDDLGKSMTEEPNQSWSNQGLALIGFLVVLCSVGLTWLMYYRYY